MPILGIVAAGQPLFAEENIVVALLGDEATVKRLRISEERIELRPKKPRYRQMVIGPEYDLHIPGKAVAVRTRPPDRRRTRIEE